MHFKKDLFANKVKHLIVMPTNLFINFSLDELIGTHIDSGNSCTVVCKKKDLFSKDDFTWVRIDPSTSSRRC